MSYFLSNPFYLSVTGLVATGAAQVPVDFGTFTMPVTGSRYLLYGMTFWSATSTGFGGNAGGFKFFTQASGSGMSLFQSDQGGQGFLTTANSATTSFVSNTTASGYFTSPTITARQMTVADCSGIQGIKIGFMSLP